MAQPLQARLDSFLASLPNKLAQKIQRDESLAKHCTYRVGGPAALWLELDDEATLALLAKTCTQQQLPLAVLGNGSNVIPDDNGFAGLVVHLGPRFCQITQVDSDHLYAQAGALLAQVSKQALALGRSGLAWMVDIPASVGGAMVMNAGNNEGQIAHVVSAARFVDENGQIHERAVDALDLAYRYSRFKKNPQERVLGATFRLGPVADKAEIHAAMRAQRETRRAKFPMQYANAGSVFKRPPGDYAGRLIQASGLKGLRVGDAQVSEKHAGFIVNLGGATATDIKNLIAQVQRRVQADSGVLLQPEQIFFGQYSGD